MGNCKVRNVAVIPIRTDARTRKRAHNLIEMRETPGWWTSGGLAVCVI